MTLPPSLQERCHWLAPPEDDPSRGAFVLYWMHNALRAEENPALDVAIAAARARDLPLLVYQGLGETYPYASDRHHAFILQGARDVQRQFADRGIQYAFQLQRPGQRGSYLKQLGQQADLIVTEEIPVEPLRGWLDRLRQRTGRPLVVVDTSCILPMRSVSGDFDDVASFRTATSEEFSHRVPRRWEAQPFDVAAYTSDLPFVPLDLQNACLARLIAECEIDHTVGPVTDTPGGSRAGYRRWQTFLAEGLSHYAEARHDAACLGTSRMSAYLHYGMVSPFRLAREAAACGAEAFLDALLVWRELAFHFCLRRGDELDTMEGLPLWAQQTLEKHRDDPRPCDCAWEDLARGKTGDPLWDNCQRSLLRHGELHGDLRSVWGTALLEWVQSPARALQMAIDLNHRYALDGRSPCSYSGILSCFGQFERPRPTEHPVFGTVRSRPLREHAARIDDARFAERATRPIAQPLPRIAIVGAGVAGLTAARTLCDHGLQVEIFEKSRGVGGRLATRRGLEQVAFDHGTQYFRARDPLFQRYLRSWLHAGLVQPWAPRVVKLWGGKVTEVTPQRPRFVGSPTMNHLAKHLAQDLIVHRERLITSVSRCGDRAGHRAAHQDRWQLIDEHAESAGAFDIVLVNCPPPQAAHILPDDSAIAPSLRQVKMLPRWAAMIYCQRPSPLPFDAAHVSGNPLAWIARDNSKPRRQAVGQAWVLHANPEWTDEHLGEDREEIVPALLEAFEQATGVMFTEPSYAVAHRWLYAEAEEALPQACLWDASEGLGACGDWCGSSGVEGAFLSGAALAGNVLRHLTIDRAAAKVAAVVYPA